MKNFFVYLRDFLFPFFGLIGTAAKENIEVSLGIFVVITFMYIVYVVISELDNKPQRIMTSTAGLFGGILGAAQLTN